MAGLSLLRVVSNDELRKTEEEKARRELDDRQQAPLLQGLAAYLRACWEVARDAKAPIRDIMLKAKRQRAGEYEPSKLSEISDQGGSTIFMRITEVKCRAAESWLRDILLDTGTPPWDLQPTPIPDLPPGKDKEISELFAQKILEIIQSTEQAPSLAEQSELREMIAQDYRFKVLQEAQTRVDGMKLKISDQFASGGWADAFNDFITDMATYPAAFLKGPVVRRRMALGWTQNPDGTTVSDAKEILAPEYERVDPFKIYPEPGITRIEDGYLFEHHPLTRMDLSDLIGVPGYDEDAIRAVLENGNGLSWISESAQLEQDQLERKFQSWNRPTTVYDALEFWGKVSGKMLRDWGLTDAEVPDPTREYDANVWLVGNYVIKATLNYDPLGEKPYSKTSFIKVPGAFWGMSIPEMIEDVQSVCNASARALVNNMGIASGPQVEVNIDRIPQNEDITQIHPWKIWQVMNDPLGSSAPAVRFNQPTDNANVLMAVYERFSRLADDHSGIPAYVSGDLNVQGAGRTASGLSMLMGSAGKGIRQVVMHIDSDVIKPVVYRQFVYNMRYDEDESIKGDVDILPRGAVNLAVKETVNMRRIEFLNATANPFDIEIVGKEGRSAILREVAKGLQMPVDEVIPSREKAAYSARGQAKMAAMSAAAGPQQGTPAPTQPDGSPKGGMEANTVTPKG